MIKQQQDKRLQRTRAWIVQAFNELIFKRSYADLRTDNIIKRAGVGRSTFYEHFRNKDAVLLHSAEWILSAIADAVTDLGSPHRIRTVLDHISDLRAMARPILTGPAGAAITIELAKLIEARLPSPNTAHHAAPIVPTRLIARQIAESQMALLRGWLDDPSACTSASLATAIHRASQALAAAGYWTPSPSMNSTSV